MYKLEFLPIAKKDMNDIIYYVSNNLKNNTAAKNISNSFINGAKSILVFPFGSSIYKTTYNLEKEYRFIKINNFLMFYTIDDKEEIITIMRVIYEKMDIKNMLD